MRYIVKEAARLLDLALLPCHRREAPELFNVERCARMLGAFESNLLSVEVECPAIKQLRKLSHGKQGQSNSQLELANSVETETATSRCSPDYSHELLARASEAVSRVSNSVAAGDALSGVQQAKKMTYRRTQRRGPDGRGGDECSASMLSSSWPCSEGVGL